MCKWGTTVAIPLVVQADQSSTGKAKFKMVGVDACIAPIVKALNDAGVPTVASCCGHGKTVGNIALTDGRELIIARDSDERKRIMGRAPPLFGAGSDEYFREVDRLRDMLDRMEVGLNRLAIHESMHRRKEDLATMDLVRKTREGAKGSK